MIQDDATSLTDQVNLIRDRMAARFDERPVVGDPVLLALSQELDTLIIRLLRHQSRAAAVEDAAREAGPAAPRTRDQAS